MTDTPATSEEIIAQLKQTAKEAADAAYAKGFADAQPPNTFEYSNGGIAHRNADPGYDEYMAEMNAKRFELLEANTFRPNHPDFAAIKSRFGR